MINKTLDLWCEKKQCRFNDVDHIECWLHAIKEGWLDDAE